MDDIQGGEVGCGECVCGGEGERGSNPPTQGRDLHTIRSSYFCEISGTPYSIVFADETVVVEVTVPFSVLVMISNDLHFECCKSERRSATTGRFKCTCITALGDF